MTFQQILEAAGAVSLVVGPVGTLLEALGTIFELPKLVAFGQRLEGLGADLPKLIRGSRFTNATNVDTNALKKDLEK